MNSIPDQLTAMGRKCGSGAARQLHRPYACRKFSKVLYSLPVLLRRIETSRSGPRQVANLA
ncbi:hypothetical protein PsYK624_120170 [Phanerochaete sordida]|uniref:Uncharacterized protein n=1 Tax=Phanerochaete sordida TaxID=48140 RepID=A0A9P3GHQ9_9APHY|nr:hypothetical protein PsYK624_120170 [Phanerochaete sordida]